MWKIRILNGAEEAMLSIYAGYTQGTMLGKKSHGYFRCDLDVRDK
jgi:hypothetical protein